MCQPQRATGSAHERQKAPPPPAEMAQPRPHEAPEGLNSRGKGHGAKTLAQREEAVLALAAGLSIAAAAAKADVGERTLKRWLAEDEPFREGLLTARRAAFAEGLQRVTGLAGQAAQALADLLVSPRTPPAVRLGAIRVAFDVAIHERETEEFERRLANLETMLERQ